jgi:hypothetical protein
MNSVQTLTTFFGWCSLITVGILFLSSVALLLMRGFLTGLHSKMFGLSQEDLARAYFQYLAPFKIVVIVFNLAPYIALRLMA